MNCSTANLIRSAQAILRIAGVPRRIVCTLGKRVRNENSIILA